MSSLCIWGTSTTFGEFDLEKGGWVNRLKIYTDELFLKNGSVDLDVYNLGISGETSHEIVGRFDAEAAAREPGIIIFDVGINDAAYIKKEGRHLVEEAEFKKNIRMLVRAAKKFTDKIFLMIPRSVDESRTDPVPWRPELSYLNEDLMEYGEFIREIADEEGVKFFQPSPLLPEDYEDGLHPNAQGHEKIFQEIKKFLEDKKILPSSNF